MVTKRRFLLIAVIVFIVGFLFSFSKPGQAVADSMKPLLVQIVNVPIPITGEVKTVPSTSVLRDAHDIISLESAFNRELLVPVGVVLTDAVVEHILGDGTCVVALQSREIHEDQTWVLHIYEFRVSEANPSAEIHFENGLPSTETRQLALFVNANCRVFALWSGYQY